jgi:hypothetical protein
MRVLALMSVLLLLTVVCSVAGLARMVGMPLGGEVVFGILMLTTLVGGLGVTLVVVPEGQVVPVQVGR